MRVFRIDAIATLAVFVTAAINLIVPTTAFAEISADDATEKHCVVFVEDDSKGVLRVGPEECFNTLAESEAYASTVQSGRSDGAQQMSSQNTIGLHFTGTYYSGSSVRIVGTTCGGGVWFATGSWNNNIESSYHYCGASQTRFWDYSSCSGPSKPITSSTHSLGSMNNRTSCVQYG